MIEGNWIGGYWIGLAIGVFLSVIVAYARYSYDAHKDRKQYEKDQIYAAFTRLENRVSRLESKHHEIELKYIMKQEAE